MSPKAICRGVWSAGATLTAVSVVLHIALRDRLRPPLKAWRQEQDRKADVELVDDALVLLAMTGVSGPSVNTGWSDATVDIAQLLAGAALATAYCHPFSDLLERPNDDRHDERVALNLNGDRLIRLTVEDSKANYLAGFWRWVELMAAGVRRRKARAPGGR